MKQQRLLERVKKAKLDFFTARPYPVQVVVYDLNKPEKLKSVFPGALPDLDDKNGLCSFWRQEGYSIICIGIRSKTGDTPALLAHECYHAMNVIYQWFGAWHDTQNDEAGAYFLGDLVRQTSYLLGFATRK